MVICEHQQCLPIYEVSDVQVSLFVVHLRSMIPILCKANLSDDEIFAEIIKFDDSFTACVKQSQVCMVRLLYKFLATHQFMVNLIFSEYPRQTSWQFFYTDYCIV